MQAASKAAEGTLVELLDGNKLISTWHDEIFELPFAVKNPDKASMYMLYTSESVPVPGNANQKIRVTTKLAKRSFGFFIELEKVSLSINNKTYNPESTLSPIHFRNTATLQPPARSSFASRCTATRLVWESYIKLV